MIEKPGLVVENNDSAEMPFPTMLSLIHGEFRYVNLQFLRQQPKALSPKNVFLLRCAGKGWFSFLLYIRKVVRFRANDYKIIAL